jgi:prepilin-type N-terminal cleavage/methylation domain-containing protein/prepilin-type processing-associated H-X9-DG protein
MTEQAKRGFTLVELLVVIAIIGVLVALLIPAVNAARELARKSQCANNIRNLAQGVAGHETQKGYYPGRINFVLASNGQQVPVSWMAKTLPYIEQNNVWDLILNDPKPLANWSDVLDALSSPTVIQPNTRWFVTNLEVASCPSDPPVSLMPARLSYVINAGIWDRTLGSNMDQWNDLRANGIAHVIPYNSTTGRVDAGFVSKNDGLTATLLLSENVNAISWVMLEEGATTMVWTTQEAWLLDTENPGPERQYAINKGHERNIDDVLLQMSRNSPDELLSTARPSSFHSGGVQAAYCDTHVEFLSDEIHPWVYARRLSTSKAQARHPVVGLNNPVPAQVSPVDSKGTAVPTNF